METHAATAPASPSSTPSLIRFVEPLARSGYAARGVVYVIVGFLALAAANSSQRARGSDGALLEISARPGGNILLSILAIALVGFATWRIIQATIDTDNHGTELKGLAIRGSLLISAATYSVLAFTAANLVIGFRFGESDSRDWSAWMMRQPGGAWFFGLVALGVMAAGVAHIWKGYHAGFEKYFDWSSHPWAQSLGRPISQFGLIARGLVFLLTSMLLIIAVVRLDADEIVGLSGALQVLHEQPYGDILLMTAGVGLLAFGLYSLIESVFRRVDEGRRSP